MITRTPPAHAPLHLAIDQGGHASRAIVFDARGAALAGGEAPIATHHPREHWVEHDPEEMVASVRRAIDETAARLGEDARRVASAGFATQRSSIVCWDTRTGAALSPVISWQDRRAHAWLENFSSHAAAVREETGLFLSPHYGASKLRWCFDHLPAVREAHAAHRLVCGPLASFLLFRLLDERPLLADPANASRTLLWRIASGGWSDALLALFQIPRDCLPRCAATRDDFGTLPFAGRGVPVRIVTGDQAAALFAFGAPRADTVYINMGTGAFLQRPATARPAHTALLASIAYRDAGRTLYTLEGTVNGAGSALAAVARELDMSVAEAERQIESALARDDAPPLYLNGVAGLGTPWWRADFASRFVSPLAGEVTGANEQQQKLAAVIESIVFLLAVNLDEMSRAPGAPQRLLLSGGLARVDGLCQRLTDLTGLALERPAEHEATARGLACLLAGQPADWPSAPGTRFTPRANPALAARYTRWREEMNLALR